jgi:tetratricopeptide (TPR) repeat protein
MAKEHDISKKAWGLREDGKPIEAIALWLPLIFENETRGNWENVVDLLIDTSIAWKIHGRQTGNSAFFSTSLGTLYRAKEIAKEHNIPLRKDWDYYLGEVLIAKGDFGDAVKSFSKYLRIASLTPEQEANIKTQIGYAKCMLGEKKEGIALLKESIQVLENPTQEFVHEGKDVIAIWLTGAMIKLAKVLEDKAESKRILKNALSIAKKKNLGAREKQIENLLK